MKCENGRAASLHVVCPSLPWPMAVPRRAPLSRSLALPPLPWRHPESSQALPAAPENETAGFAQGSENFPACAGRLRAAANSTGQGRHEKKASEGTGKMMSASIRNVTTQPAKFLLGLRHLHLSLLRKQREFWRVVMCCVSVFSAKHCMHKPRTDWYWARLSSIIRCLGRPQAACPEDPADVAPASR